MATTSVFDKFTNRYALSKTLRFELKPVGKTRENIEKVNPGLFHDQEIEDAYQALKPVFDILHEEFITKSLENSAAKKISVAEYFDFYKEFRAEQDKSKKNKIEKELEKIENNLRKYFSSIWLAQGNDFKQTVGRDEKGKEILKENGFKVLTEAGILKYIKKHIEQYAAMNLLTRDGKKVEVKALEKALGTAQAKGVFEGFFTYFGGFNQNRENYYSTEAKATGVANRIITENLPKFCDNVIEFKQRTGEYVAAYEFLNSRGIALKTKGQKGEEIILDPIAVEIFEIEHFKNCLSQKEIEKYNVLVGNANNLINRYNQQQDEKSKKLRLFKTLYKQIGCGEKSEFISVIKDENELKEILKKIAVDGHKYFGKFDEKITDKVDTIGEFVHYIKTCESYKGVYWNDKALNTISSKYFSNWYTLKKTLKEGGVFGGKKKDDEDIKIPQAIELQELFEILDKVESWKDRGVLFKDSLFEEVNVSKRQIIEKGGKASSVLLDLIFEDIKNLAKKFAEITPEIEGITDYKNNTTKIKEWLDCLLFTNQIIKYWKVKDKFAVDSVLAESLKTILTSENNPTKNYDVVRNYLTKKPQDELNKLKLNFENGQLLGGWSDGQEKNKGAVILCKNGKYFVGILNKKNIFDTERKDSSIYTEDGDAGRLILMNLKFQTLAGKGYLGKYGITYSDEGKLNPKKAIEHLQEIIRERYAEKYPLLKRTIDKQYADKKLFDKLIQDTLKDCYVCEFKKISWGEVQKFIDSGELFVFEICCRKTMQVNYWNEVFRESSSVQLLGGGEIFYRPASTQISKKVKEGYENKKDKNGVNYVYTNRRFTEEKFLFHCPIKLNYREKSYGKPIYAVTEINQNINNEITKKDNEIIVIGVDRGEKHLAYYFVLKQTKDGVVKTLDQGSFNEISGQNYSEKLEKVASGRAEARKNWKTIGTIKELKDGYISQVIRKIVDLAIYEDVEKKVLREKPAFIVLENLNIGFKRGRQKIEKQVYQKLELALAKKLNFLVDKDAKVGELGSVTRALQLTPPVNNFGDIEGKKQFGIMLYTKADYTSQTDPTTGWRKTIYLKRGSEDSIKRQILENFEDIGFDDKDYYFKYTDKNTKEPWILYSSKDGHTLDRYYRELVNENSDKKWTPKKQDVLEMLNGLFEGFDKNSSLFEQLNKGKNPNKINEHTAWESLRFAIDLIQQIRNTGISDNDSDFIYSPVRKNGNHFDSRKTDESLPTSGDANGAYNIARKGIIMCEHIKQDWNLFISDDEWSAWLAGKEVWEQWTENNKDKLKKAKVD